MADYDQCCCSIEGEQTCTRTSLTGSLSEYNNSKSSFCSVHGDGHGKRTQYLHQLCTLKKTLMFSVTLFIVICMLTAVIVLLVVPGHEVPSPLTTVQLNKTCLNCQTLREMVDTWAWKGISEDKQTGQCCFNSELGLFSTLKSVNMTFILTIYWENDLNTQFGLY